MSKPAATSPRQEMDDRTVEVWPAVSEYYLYDEFLYYAMSHDRLRNASYKIAIDQLVKDKIVLDIGTGRDAILSRFCVEAGARRVYAVEILQESYEHALSFVKELGLDDRIIVIHGDATVVQLPEQVDVCVSEIIGPIGSMEGVASILNAARRWLRPDGTMIPSRSITQIAAVSIPAPLHENPAFTLLSGHYADRVFEQVGRKFDPRLCIKGLTRADLISNSEVFEDLNFTGRIQPEYQHQITLTISRDGRLDGLLLWLNLHTCDGEVIDVLERPHCWLPVIFPVFYPGIEVSQGDFIRASCTTTLCENALNPNYRVKGCLFKKKGAQLDFDYPSHHQGLSFRNGPFYERLFPQESQE